MIYQLYDDDEDSDYPLIEIKDSSDKNFELLLKTYRKNHRGTYNIDDFIKLLETKKWFIGAIYSDGSIYF